MLTAIAILLDGLSFSAWLFLSSAGLTMIYGVMRILNIAHGSFYAFGAYTAAMFVGLYSATEGHPALVYLLLLLAALLVGILLGLLIERGFLQFMYKSDEVLMVLATYGIFLMLEDAAKLIWGVDPYYAFQPYAYLGIVDIFGLPYQIYDLALIALSLICGGLLWWGINKTRTGKLLLVVIEDREISAALGINVALFFTVTFIIGATLGALGGAVTAPKISVNPGLGVEVIVMAFAVVVIGGLGSIGGAMLGAIIVGFARAACVHLLPEIELFAIYGVMAVVLAVKPYGLFARTEGRKI